MAVENTTLTAPRLWGSIIQKNPDTIVAITGVHYFSASHGVPSRNIPLSEHKGMMLEEHLLEDQLPNVEEDHKIGIPFPKRTPKAEFAMGTPVYVWIGDRGDPRDQKVWAGTICYENEANLKQMKKWKIVQPMAMLMADLDCANTPENLHRITDVLQETQTKSRRSLLDTGLGFHFIDEELFEPMYYPQRLGKLINDFVPTAPQGRRHIIEAFGNDLQKHWWNPKRLQKWAWDALRTFKHYDDTSGDGIPFILDMRHAAHSVIEYLRFMANETGGWGFLRISGKSLTDNPPIVVAKQPPKKEIELFNPSLLKTSTSQMRLW